MLNRYKKLLIVPIVVIIISLYLIGINFINRVDRVDDIKDAVPVSDGVKSDAAPKTAEQEDAELSEIIDKININTATKSEIMLLDGVGDTISGRIIAWREENGQFTSVDQLLEINGIGEKLFNSIKDYVTVENQQNE